MKKDDSPTFGRWSGYLVFAIIVIATVHRETLGIQLAGILEVIVGLSIVHQQRIGYGWRGRPASGYLKGLPAVVLGLLAVGPGIFMLLRPAVVASWSSRHH